MARLRFTDINWKAGTIQVTGKGRRQVRLPLPQDVGDALLRYLDFRPQVDDASHVSSAVSLLSGHLPLAAVFPLL